MINYAVVNCGYFTRRLFAIVGECIVLGPNSDIRIFNLTLTSCDTCDISINSYKQQIIVCNIISIQ